MINLFDTEFLDAFKVVQEMIRVREEELTDIERKKGNDEPIMTNDSIRSTAYNDIMSRLEDMEERITEAKVVVEKNVKRRI